MADSSVVQELINDLNYYVLYTYHNEDSGMWDEDEEVYLSAKAVLQGFDLRLV